MISIIIPTLDRNDLLIKCLDLLHPDRQHIDYIQYEIVVSDDSEDNRARALIEEKYNWVKWVEGPKRGSAANRNNAVKYALGDWLLFVDDDCLPEEQWISSYLSAIRETEFLVFEGQTIADRPKQRFDEEAPINTDGNKLWSCNFAIRKDLFERLQGFDETFPHAAMEDVDFYTRIVKVTKILFLPQARVIHPWRRVKPFRNLKKHLKSHKYFAEKYKLNNTLKFKLERTKILFGSIFLDLKSLFRFSMKGWALYIEKIILNFCIIFI